jgi:drug/metabolite transporter (DMT)-like permease
MNKQDRRLTLLSWGLLIFLALIWGSSFILIKKGLNVFNATEVAGIRMLSASLFMTPFALYRIKKIEKRKYGLLFVSGFIGSLIPAFLFALAQTRLESSITGIINALTPIFVLLVGILFFNQRITNLIIIGLLLSFGGTLGLIFAGEGNTFVNPNYFALLVVLATILYGLNVNIIKFSLQGISPTAIASVSLLFIGPFAAIQLFGFTDFSGKLTSHKEGYFAFSYLAFLGVIGTAFALIVFNKLVKLTTPLFSSSVTYLIPIVAILWGVWDGERLFFLHYASIFTILIGVYIANRKLPS